MSVLVKGMEMPNGCNTCALLQIFDENETVSCPLSPYYVWSGVAPDYRPDGCPLVEIPTPHGRLIDADKLVWFIDNHIAAGKKWVEFETIKDMINSLPTIIDAEVSEE